MIEWKEEFQLGIASVDYEHRELIELINNLYRSYCAEGSKLTVLDFLGELYARIASHFALEEKLMSDRGYDQRDDHKQDHERLLDEICDFMDAYRDDKIFDKKAFGETLEHWFVEHFRTRDARLHKYLR